MAWIRETYYKEDESFMQKQKWAVNCLSRIILRYVEMIVLFWFYSGCRYSNFWFCNLQFVNSIPNRMQCGILLQDFLANFPLNLTPEHTCPELLLPALRKNYWFCRFKYETHLLGMKIFVFSCTCCYVYLYIAYYYLI